MRTTPLLAASLLPPAARALSPNLWFNWTWIPGDGALPLSQDGAYVNGEVVASAIYLYVSNSIAEGSVSVDGEEYPIDDNTAYAFDRYGRHVFDVSGPLERLEATLGIESEASSFDAVPKRVESFVTDGGRNTFFQCETTSVTKGTAQVPLGADGTSMETRGVLVGPSRCSFAVRHNTSFLVLTGYARADGPDDVILQTLPPAPFPLRERYSVLRRNGAGDERVVLDAVVLDPAVDYVMTVESRGAVSALALADVTFYSALADTRRSPPARVARRHAPRDDSNNTSIEPFMPTASHRPFGGDNKGASDWGGTGGAGRAATATPALLALALVVAGVAIIEYCPTSQ